MKFLRERRPIFSIYKCRAPLHKEKIYGGYIKLQIKFNVRSADGSNKNVTKTFSNINAAAAEEQLKDFALAYTSLIEASDVEVYLVKLEQL